MSNSLSAYPETWYDFLKIYVKNHWRWTPIDRVENEGARQSRSVYYDAVPEVYYHKIGFAHEYERKKLLDSKGRIEAQKTFFQHVDNSFQVEMNCYSDAKHLGFMAPEKVSYVSAHGTIGKNIFYDMIGRKDVFLFNAAFAVSKVNGKNVEEILKDKTIDEATACHTRRDDPVACSWRRL